MSNLKQIELDIVGMNCSGCANSINSYVSKLEGVKNVNVSFSSETAKIDFEENLISLPKIISSIRSLGFDVIEDEDSIEQEKKEKLRKLQRTKIFTAIGLSLIIMVLAMKDHIGFVNGLNVPHNINLLIQLLLSSVVVFWCGIKFLKGAISSVRTGVPDMNALVSLGTMSSFTFSLVITANHVLSLEIKALNGMHEVYYETAAMITTFILIGNYLEVVLKSKAQTSIKSLKGLQSKTVIIERGGEEITIPFKKVKAGDIVLIKSGDKIPIDGVIQNGNCVVDESAMTGESLPVEKRAGEPVISGTILKNGFIKVKALKTGNDTRLAKIINLVKDAANSKPEIQKLADKISAVFVPLVLVIALATFAIWNFVLGAEFSKAMLNAVSVLIIACPCALGLASPMAVVVGIGRSADNGILFNNINAIEKLNKINTLCFDKTGTITTGELKFENIVSLNEYSIDELLRYVFTLEKHFNHPIAKSIVHYCADNGIDAFKDADNFSNEHGLGVTGYVNGKEVAVGSLRFIKEKVFHSGLSENGFKEFESLNSKGNLFISINNEICGRITFDEDIKFESKSVINDLKKNNFEIYMISGDNEYVTKSIAKEVGINNYFSRVFPEDKLNIVEQLQSNNHKVAMVGDGINDAPALAKADVGIAIGSGTDVAIDSADVILVKGDLRNIAKAINISKKTVQVIKQNIFWAFFYNIIAIPLAAGLLSPWGIVVSPVLAAMLMAFSDVVTVIGNSLRLKKVKI
ncbi:MAG: heavy metal translocating P-type ATPase [Ignavibacteria bacterium]|nr:heavy metal translocating P-type ATPase [Ignavibacteria bacterium]